MKPMALVIYDSETDLVTRYRRIPVGERGQDRRTVLRTHRAELLHGEATWTDAIRDFLLHPLEDFAL
jgi:hypothetical protein